jgi:hypothetical protein
MQCCISSQQVAKNSHSKSVEESVRVHEEIVDSRRAVDIITIRLWLELAQRNDHNDMVAKDEKLP